MTRAELEEKLIELAKEIRTATDNYSHLAREHAEKDHVYRKAKAIAYLATSGTVPERTAYVDKACDGERLNAHLSDALREAAKERLRALQAELSAFQSVVGMYKAEAQIAGRYGE